jgi:hypothetical protein
MVLARGKHDKHRDEGGDHESKIDLEVSGQDEPPVPMSFLQFSSGLRGANRASRTVTLVSRIKRSGIQKSPHYSPPMPKPIRKRYARRA